MPDEEPQLNPFASPQAVSQENVVNLSHEVKWLALRQAISTTHVWLYILALAMFSLGLFSFLASANTLKILIEFQLHPTLVVGLALGIATGLVLILSSILLFLWGFAVGRFRSRPSTVSMENMLLAQARFWQVSAIGTLLIVGLGIASSLLFAM